MQGLLFDDRSTPKKKFAPRVVPPIPDTGWRPPREFPNLSAASVLSFDVETYDPELEEAGPGWARGRGHIVGFSIGARARDGSRGKWYFPIRHHVQPEYNLDAATALRWASSVLSTTPHIPKVGANLTYDAGWFMHEGVNIVGPLYDVQFAEALLDNDALQSLDVLGWKYLRRNKTSDALYQWLSEAYGGGANGKQRANIWRAPPALVGFYGEDDADLPIDILEKQWPLLAEQGLLPVFGMECRLIYLMIAMRFAGAPVDVPYAEHLYGQLGHDIEVKYQELYQIAPVKINSVQSPQALAKVFDYLGLSYGKTKEGNPSFQKEFLKGVLHPAADKINEIRELEKLRSTFVRGYILEKNVNGKLYCSFNQLKSEGGGTLTGRFSSSDPNLQNIPSRTPEGKKIRQAFIHEREHEFFYTVDYSQIEYRMLAHYAVGPGSVELRDSYIQNPRTDYHNKVMTSFAQMTGVNLDAMSKEERDTFRKPIKNVNFGLLYGQTQKALAYKAGMSPDQARQFFASYHETAPYVKPTMEHIAREVQTFGYITTIAGRRTRFNLWEPSDERGPALPYNEALHVYGRRIRRAYDYRGVNYKFQGSAADVMKAAMLACWESGVFNVIGVPRLTVHDELGFSWIDKSKEVMEAHEHMIYLLENSTPCNVPIVAEYSFGANWKEAK